MRTQKEAGAVQLNYSSLFEGWVRYLAQEHGLAVKLGFDMNPGTGEAYSSDPENVIAAYDPKSLRLVGFTGPLSRLTEFGVEQVAKHEIAHAYAHQRLGLTSDDNYICHNAQEWVEACDFLRIPPTAHARSDWLQPQYRLGELLNALEPE
jgi:hypothetical protein